MSTPPSPHAGHPDLRPDGGPLARELRLALALAEAAAEVVRQVYAAPFEVTRKSDGSPLTVADQAANDIILAGLRAAFPQDAVLSEEAPYRPGAPDPNDPDPSDPDAHPPRLWLIDPLDGTRDFADRTGDFAVMIGLCIDGEPALGVVAAPALRRTWYGGPSFGAFECTAEGRLLVLDVRDAPDTDALSAQSPLRVLVSRAHRPPELLERLLERLPNAQPTPRGSVGVKCGLLASGEADVYLHPTRGTNLWDCAAPTAILTGAGGKVTDSAGRPVVYDPCAPRNPGGLLAGRRSTHALALNLLAPGTTGGT